MSAMNDKGYKNFIRSPYQVSAPETLAGLHPKPLRWRFGNEAITTIRKERAAEYAARV